MIKRLIPSLILTWSACLYADDGVVTFNRDVRPILADRCFHCHGPDAATREADLRLDQEESAKGNRDGYAAITEGDPENSAVVRRITSHDSDLVMPPPDSGRSLSREEKSVLLKWIKNGAKWEGHWAFNAPERPKPPAVSNAKWPRNAIDYFVLKKLGEVGLRPSEEVDRPKWIRRVTFDLTGLPPTLQEVDDFLGDDSPDAYERVVDRLLKSPRYGEHMAATWLDAARYADTDGYQNDGPRTMFRWRDWVIDAYNSNMPFSQFTIEQLAGDLLPNATMAQKVATGFNRNHRYNSEAGLVLEEFLLENAVDRVDTTSTVWMGLTMGCARCHDHKYDPFSQREYYQLISFFDNISECGRAIKFGNSEPWIPAPTDEQQQQLGQLDAQLQSVSRDLKSARSEIAEVLHDLAEVYVEGNEDPEGDQFDDGLVVTNGLTHRFGFEDMEAEGITIEQGGPVLREGLDGKAATVGGNGVFSLGQVGNVACQIRSTICFWLKPEELKSGVVLSRQTKNTRRPGFTVELRNGHLQFYIITRWIAGVGAVETKAKLKAGEWVHVTLTNDGSQRAKGQKIWLNGEPVATQILHNTNSNTGGTAKNAVLRIGGGVYGDKFQGQVDDLRFYNRTLFADEIHVLSEPLSVAAALKTPYRKLPQRSQEKLIAWLVGFENQTQGKDGGFGGAKLKDAVAVVNQSIRLRTKRLQLLDSFPTTMVMEERPTPKDTHVRVRGVYDNYGDVVVSNVPDVFPEMSKGGRADRHDFAKWLVSGRHPLTARVAVNRYWQQYFGAGLVRTTEDFGMQGELPSHPELLDWLAVEFVESGWNVQHMQKLIVLSSTYRQSSRHRARDGELNPADVDPQNRLFWRGPRFRLTARQLRDQALFVSGLMTPDIGGPSVSPYQPANLWEEMSNMKYRQSKGKDLYRRGLYTIWKRTVAPPGLAILDAADRENCIVRPKRTNTPLQALTLLNETTFVEAARHLAMRMVKEGGDEPIVFAFRMVTARYPTEKEKVSLEQAREMYRAEFRDDSERAMQLLSVGESKLPKGFDSTDLAADTMLCNVLLNLDEVVTKE